ncbi:hypothetical protein TNCV_4486021 [Trichonephila clavipes]|nr:hypothetical protein TNCV_4486021 [Trichonephila clavipes]
MNEGSSVALLNNLSLVFLRSRPSIKDRSQSEIVAIYEGLPMRSDPMPLWILSDSRSDIQHMSNCSSVGDKTGTGLKQVS